MASIFEKNQFKRDLRGVSKQDTYDPGFWDKNKQLADQGIGTQTQYPVDQGIGGFPTYNVDQNIGTIPGTNNTVVPTSNPWAQTQAVDPQEQIPINYPGGQNDGSLLQVANQGNAYTNFGGSGFPQVFDHNLTFQENDLSGNIIDTSGIGEGGPSELSLNQIDEQATPTNNLLAAASTDIDGAAAAAAKKKKTQAGLKKFGDSLASLGQGMMEGGYEYDFLGDEDEDSIYG
jgi:hypothetical protein